MVAPKRRRKDHEEVDDSVTPTQIISAHVDVASCSLAILPHLEYLEVPTDSVEPIERISHNRWYGSFCYSRN